LRKGVCNIKKIKGMNEGGRKFNVEGLKNEEEPSP